VAHYCSGVWYSIPPALTDPENQGNNPTWASEPAKIISPKNKIHLAVLISSKTAPVTIRNTSSVSTLGSGRGKFSSIRFLYQNKLLPRPGYLAEQLMKKILVFYDSTDLELARDVSGAIKAIGFSPWLADDDSKVDWHAELAELVPTDICAGAVVIWSQKSKLNPVVRDEAKEIVKVDKPLVRMLMNGVDEAPLGLTDGPRFRFDGTWNGQENDKLKDKLASVFGENHPVERALIINGKKLLAPSMVLSVSSFETQIEPDTSLSLLKHARPPAVLVSAYDLLRPQPTSTKKPRIKNTKAIAELRETGSMVFLDSGNYEAMRYKDPHWKKGKKRLLEAAEKTDVDLAFTHDSFPDKTPLMEVSTQRRIDEVSKEYSRDQSLIDCAIAPIIHAPRLTDNRYYYDGLPEICCGVVRAVDPPMIAVAERELGDGIMERICTVARIRKALNEQGSETLLHVLGTGNPITMAFLSLAGADFFDGLEWCRTAIDGKSWRLYHFQQWDMFATQTGLITSPEIAAVVRNQTGAMPWFMKVAFHNIAFFLQASEEIRTHQIKGSFERLCSDKDLWVEFKLVNERLEGLR
jgi:queuine/archaeosine tRNA-ribosyltransferase